MSDLPLLDSDNPQSTGPRRISRRNRGGGLAFSQSSISDSTTREGDRDLNSNVEALAGNIQPSLPPRDPSPYATALNQQPAASMQEDFNPRARMDQVRRRASVYEREYRLKLLHRLMMRNVPMDEISEQLGISMSQVYRDREELRSRLRAEASELDINHIIGDSKGFYEEAAAMSLRAASASTIPMPIRLAALRTALAAQNDKHRFFQTAGVYEALRFRQTIDSSSTNAVRQLMLAAEKALSGDEGLSFSQREADTADTEEVEL